MSTTLFFRVVQQSDVESLLINWPSLIKSLRIISEKLYTFHGWLDTIFLFCFLWNLSLPAMSDHFSNKAVSKLVFEFIGSLKKFTRFGSRQIFSMNLCLMCLAMTVQGSFKHASNMRSAEEKSVFFSNSPWISFTCCKHFLWFRRSL